MQDLGVIISVLTGVVVLGVTNAGVWLKLGRLDSGVEGVKREQVKVTAALKEVSMKSCPFPACPVMNRAISEAAPTRERDDA